MVNTSFISEFIVTDRSFIYQLQDNEFLETSLLHKNMQANIEVVSVFSEITIVWFKSVLQRNENSESFNERWE